MDIIHHNKSSPYLSTNNNKISIKISIISIVLSLLFYCYLSIVKPYWLLDSYLKNYFLCIVSFLISFYCILKISVQVILNLSDQQKYCLTVPTSLNLNHSKIQKYLKINILYLPYVLIIVELSGVCQHLFILIQQPPSVVST